MKRVKLIRVWNRNSLNARTGKYHIAGDGVGKAFCGAPSDIESGDYMSLKEFKEGGETCERCLKLARSKCASPS